MSDKKQQLLYKAGKTLTDSEKTMSDGLEIQKKILETVQADLKATLETQEMMILSLEAQAAAKERDDNAFEIIEAGFDDTKKKLNNGFNDMKANMKVAQATSIQVCTNAF